MIGSPADHRTFFAPSPKKSRGCFMDFCISSVWLWWCLIGATPGYKRHFFKSEWLIFFFSSAASIRRELPTRSSGRAELAAQIDVYFNKVWTMDFKEMPDIQRNWGNSKPNLFLFQLCSSIFGRSLYHANGISNTSRIRSLSVVNSLQRTNLEAMDFGF